MTTELQTPTSGPEEAVTEAAGEASALSVLSGRVLWIILVLVVLFGGAYALAWYNANQLTTRFMRDANAQYDKGNYMDALVGGEEFNQQSNDYVKIGGYFDVLKIWSSRFSWPRPPAYQQAQKRAQDIIYKRLTVAEAEQYIQSNIGRRAPPFFGEIYLRLGELYEQEGDTADAIDVYQSMESLFPNRPDLIQQAQAHLKRLQAQ